MLDLSQPLELDDGTPVELITAREGTNFFRCRVPKGMYRPDQRPRRAVAGWDQPGNWAFMEQHGVGVFSGGDTESMYCIRNVADEAVVEEDWS